MNSGPDHGDDAVVDSFSVALDPGLRIESPIAALALKEWHRLRGDRAMPAPTDLDPLDLPRRLLPYLLLLDVEHQPRLRFRWRLIGTHITGVLNRDLTGRYWDEFYDERDFAALTISPLWTVEHRQPVRVLSAAHYVSKDHLRSESIDMPLSHDGVTVARIMSVTVYNVDWGVAAAGP